MSCDSYMYVPSIGTEAVPHKNIAIIVFFCQNLVLLYHVRFMFLENHVLHSGILTYTLKEENIRVRKC